MAAGSRREARERALGLLYEAEAKGEPVAETLRAQVLPPDPFVAELVTGVERERGRLDGYLARFARGWTIERMAVLDRTILRMAILEILERPEIPTAAVISEAVELAKRYSTEDSGRFVNGVLASVAAEVRPPTSPPST